MRQALVVLAAVLLFVTPFIGSAGAGAAHHESSIQPANGTTTAGAAGTATQQAVESCATTPQSGAPAEDTIGWHDGYWYDDELSIDESDGYSEQELDALVARTAARYEALRCWEIDETPPVEVKDRSAVNTSQSFFGNVTDSARTFLNAQYETLLMIGPDRDAIEVRKQNLGSSVLGYYDPEAKEIVLVSDGTEQLEVNEFTLAQEIGHATQDQRYNLSRYNATIHDLNIAETGLIEGDANLVQDRYEARCEGAWDGTCYEPDQQSGGGGGLDLADFGPYLLTLHPYIDGPPWAEYLYEQGGWDRVDETYANPPRTTSELIEPETYPDTTPPTVSLTRRTPRGWEQVTGQGPDYQIIGEAGIAGMVMSPTFETGGQDGVLPRQQLYVPTESGQPRLTYNYTFSDGWAGDRMHVYEDGSGETTTVWRIGWETTRDNEQFLRTYRELLEYRGARQVGDNGTVYRFGRSSDFSGAVAVVAEGNTTTIINGPSTAAVAQFDPRVEASGTASSGPVPGFGPVAAVLALLVSAGLLFRRR